MRSATNTPYAPQARWRRYQQCRPMFHGQHSLEEIAWHEGIERPVLAELLEYYGAHLACIVTPAEEIGEVVEEVGVGVRGTHAG